jgi:hypothetical protein
MKIAVPKGKKVEFRIDGGEIFGTEGKEFVLSENLTINFSSRFGDLVSSGSPKMLKVASGLLGSMGLPGAGILSGKFKQLGFQVWESTEPLSTSFTVKVFMKNDAYNDVVAPAIALAKICLPREDVGGSLIGPGPTIEAAFEGEEKLGKSRKITCQIGNFRISNVVMERAQPTFSKTTDQYGYPIEATIEISIKTIYTATIEEVEKMVL